MVVEPTRRAHADASLDGHQAHSVGPQGFQPGTNGRPPRHGSEFIFGDPASWGTPDVTTVTDTRLYGVAVARSWNRLHPRLTYRLWQAFLRRFDIEHTFRLLKQTLGWTCPKISTPQAADRWTWLILAVYAQLRLARGLTADLRRPWEKPTPPERLSPARVRRGFRHLRAKTACLASAPKPSRPGPGRPPGRRNKQSAQRHDVHIRPRARTKPKTSTTPRPRRTG